MNQYEFLFELSIIRPSQVSFNLPLCSIPLAAFITCLICPSIRAAVVSSILHHFPILLSLSLSFLPHIFHAFLHAILHLQYMCIYMYTLRTYTYTVGVNDISGFTSRSIA